MVRCETCGLTFNLRQVTCPRCGDIPERSAYYLRDRVSYCAGVAVPANLVLAAARRAADVRGVLVKRRGRG